MEKLLASLIGFFIALGASRFKPEVKPVTVILGGDVMLGRTVMTTSLDKNDPSYPFRNIDGILKSADIALVNLENPIVVGCPRRTGGMVFCADPRMVSGLINSGIDVVNLANNHTLNHGKEGLSETEMILTNSGISFTGTGDLIIKEVSGTKFGFLGFEKSQLGEPKLTAEERGLVIESNDLVDVLVVSMHWGVEYKNTALPGVSALARELVSYGADVVHGHHPHWVQNIEYINGKPIYYSLGNLVFDQMWSEKTREGVLVKLTFENGMLTGEEHIKTYMSEWAQPEIITE